VIIFILSKKTAIFLAIHVAYPKNVRTAKATKAKKDIQKLPHKISVYSSYFKIHGAEHASATT
jgi:hypothetical protein